MSYDDREDNTLYRVLMNDEEQYSMWPAGREIPRGWRATGFEGLRQACLDHIREIWTDFRPLSLRRTMEGAARQAGAEASGG